MYEEMSELQEDVKYDSLLMVSASKGDKLADKDYVKKLSRIMSSMLADGAVDLGCVTESSINNALKAIAIVTTEEIPNLIFYPYFTKGNLDDGLIIHVDILEGVEIDGNIDYEDALLKIKGSKNSEDNSRYVRKLSNAVLSCFSKRDTALLRCCGVASCSNAVLASSFASYKSLYNEVQLRYRAKFTTVEFNHEEKTGIIIEALKINE